MKDPDAGGGHTIQITVDILVPGAEVGPGDIAQADDLPVRAVLDHDIGELFGLNQPAQRAHRVLEIHALDGRLLADLTGRHLDILLAQRLDHVAGSHVARRQLIGIEPNPHAVVPAPKDERLAHPVQTRQFVLDLNQGIIAQVELVVAPVGRDQVHDQHQVGRPLDGGHPRLLDHIGQHGQGQRHAVLDHHLSHVQVGAHLEGHGQHIGAVVAALRRHVEHVLHAVDLLLDGRSHGVRHYLRAGTWVGAGDAHGGRRNLGILGHGQREHGCQTGQRDHNRRHGGQDRTIDEEP